MSRILGALSELNKFLLNQQVRTQSGAVSGTSRNTDVENQEPIGARFQDDPHPAVASSVHRSYHSVDSDPDKAPHRCHRLLCVLNNLCLTVKFFILLFILYIFFIL